MDDESKKIVLNPVDHPVGTRVLFRWKATDNVAEARVVEWTTNGLVDFDRLGWFVAASFPYEILDVVAPVHQPSRPWWRFWQ